MPWNYLPERFGASATVHGWFQRFATDHSVGSGDVLVTGVSLIASALPRGEAGK
ncbi:MAG: hypothetical protein ACLPUT_16450 [Solirubrobacteraceae bacterium]|jgi:hypothetical protein